MADTELSPSDRLRALNQVLAQRLDESLTLPEYKRFDLIKLLEQNVDAFPKSEQDALREAAIAASQQEHLPDISFKILVRATRKAMDAAIKDKDFANAKNVANLQEAICSQDPDSNLGRERIEDLLQAAKKSPAATLPPLPEAPANLEIIPAADRLHALTQAVTSRLNEDLTLPEDKQFFDAYGLRHLARDYYVYFPQSQQDAMQKAYTASQKEGLPKEAQAKILREALHKAIIAANEDKDFASDMGSVTRLQRAIRDDINGDVNRKQLEALVRAAAKDSPAVAAAAVAPAASAPASKKDAPASAPTPPAELTAQQRWDALRSVLTTKLNENLAAAPAERRFSDTVLRFMAADFMKHRLPGYQQLKEDKTTPTNSVEGWTRILQKALQTPVTSTENVGAIDKFQNAVAIFSMGDPNSDVKKAENSLEALVQQTAKAQAAALAGTTPAAVAPAIAASAPKASAPEKPAAAPTPDAAPYDPPHIVDDIFAQHEEEAIVANAAAAKAPPFAATIDSAKFLAELSALPKGDLAYNDVVADGTLSAPVFSYDGKTAPVAATMAKATPPAAPTATVATTAPVAPAKPAAPAKPPAPVANLSTTVASLAEGHFEISSGAKKALHTMDGLEGKTQLTKAQTQDYLKAMELLKKAVQDKKYPLNGTSAHYYDTRIAALKAMDFGADKDGKKTLPLPIADGKPLDVAADSHHFARTINTGTILLNEHNQHIAHVRADKPWMMDDYIRTPNHKTKEEKYQAIASAATDYMHNHLMTDHEVDLAFSARQADQKAFENAVQLAAASAVANGVTPTADGASTATGINKPAGTAKRP